MNASRQVYCRCNYAVNILPSSGALYSQQVGEYICGVQQGHNTDLKATP